MARALDPDAELIRIQRTIKLDERAIKDFERRIAAKRRNIEMLKADEARLIATQGTKTPG